jgi:hypothetical protein
LLTNNSKSLLNIANLSTIYLLLQEEKLSNYKGFLVRSDGFEPSTLGLENRCSIQLS